MTCKQKYKVIRYPSTWEIYNEETHFAIMEQPFPYKESNSLNQFFKQVTSCKTDEEVDQLYENVVRQWQDE